MAEARQKLKKLEAKMAKRNETIQYKLMEAYGTNGSNVTKARLKELTAAAS